MKVQKNDGNLEEFDRAKIVNGILKAGGTQAEADGIAGQVEVWASNIAVDGVVKSIDIKTKLLALLGEVNPTAKASFENYVKPGV